MMMMGEFVTVTSLMTLAVVRNLLLLFSLLLAHNNGWGGVSCGIFAVMHNTEHTEWLIEFPPRENSAQTCRRCFQWRVQYSGHLFLVSHMYFRHYERRFILWVLHSSCWTLWNIADMSDCNRCRLSQVTGNMQCSPCLLHELTLV